MLRSPPASNRRDHARAWLTFASGAFWFSWFLTPAVGTTHFRRLLLAGYVLSVSDVLRLAALVAYALGLTALLSSGGGKSKATRVGAVFVLIGVVGLTLNPLLRSIRPEVFMMMFFWGHLGLVPRFGRQTALARLGLGALLMTPIVAALGWVAVRAGIIQPPIAGLAVLGAITSSLALSVGYEDEGMTGDLPGEQ